MKEAQYGTRCMNPDVYQISDYPCVEEASTLWTEQHSNIIPECDCDTTGKCQTGCLPRTLQHSWFFVKE